MRMACGLAPCFCGFQQGCIMLIALTSEGIGKVLQKGYRQGRGFLNAILFTCVSGAFVGASLLAKIVSDAAY